LLQSRGWRKRRWLQQIPSNMEVYWRKPLRLDFSELYRERRLKHVKEDSNMWYLNSTTSNCKNPNYVKDNILNLARSDFQKQGVLVGYRLSHWGNKIMTMILQISFLLINVVLLREITWRWKKYGGEVSVCRENKEGEEFSEKGRQGKQNNHVKLEILMCTIHSNPMLIFYSSHLSHNKSYMSPKYISLFNYS
jgi:hypothetical protein